MAKLLYEEERIRNIAQKIKQFVPYLRIDGFTTKEMADGVEHVHEAGKARGRVEGYGDGREDGYNIGYASGCEKGYTDGHDKGYQSGLDDGTKAVKEGESRTDSDIIIEGDSFTVPSGYYAITAEKHINIDPFYDAGYIDGYVRGKEEGLEAGSGGVELPTLDNPGTADDLVEGKQLIDGEGNIVEGAVPVRTVTDLEFEMLGQFDLGLTVTSGYYDDGVTKIIDVKPYYNEGQVKGYANGYNVGLTEGEQKVKTEEARTEADINGGIDYENDFANVNIPSGYYAGNVEKKVDLATYYTHAYDTGYDDGVAANTYEDGNEVRY